MTLTKEELDELRLECANAKVRCQEVWQTLLQLESITKTYFRIHDLWKARYEKADRTIAMEERRIVETLDNKKKKQKSVFEGMSKEQLLALADEILEENE